MKLSVVVPVLGQHELSKLAIDLVRHNADESLEVVVIDQGGDFKLEDDNPTVYNGVDIYKPVKNIGVYPAFKYGMDIATGDVVLFIHSDLLINEPEYDKRLLQAFEGDPSLGLVGFIGSDQIDAAGGRGAGTTSNFQGLVWHDGKSGNWVGSPAEAHGRRFSGLTKAAVVDGCAIALRRSAWDKIGFRNTFPIHHHYDRLISCQMLEAGYSVGVLGVACDHISGQTTSSESRYHDAAQEWCMSNNTKTVLHEGSTSVNWDATIYQEAERQFLREYRDEKHVVPIRV